MKLTIKLFASLTGFLPSGSEKQTTAIEAQEGATVGEVISGFGIPLEECRLVIINGITHTNPAFSMEITLSDGDTLAVLPRVH